MGLARTELSTYLPAFMIAGALCTFAAALALLLGPEARTRAMAARA